MKNETARQEIESLDYYLRNHTNDYSEESHTAMMMAIDALSKPQEPKTGHWIALEEWKKDFKGFINELSMPKDDYNGIMEYIDELPVTPQPKTGYISIDDVMSVFDDFMCGEVDEDGTDTFLKMLKDKAESEGK